jgi:uncharacterized membrane protein
MASNNTQSGIIPTRLYWLAAALALAGLTDALYLTYQHLTGAHVQCTVISGCGEVLGSKYAYVGKYPLAGLGAAAYFTAFSLATLAASGYRQAATLFFPLTLIMFATTLYLLYLQAFVIERFCQYCLLSAAVTTGLTILAFISRKKTQN